MWIYISFSYDYVYFSVLKYVDYIYMGEKGMLVYYLSIYLFFIIVYSFYFFVCLSLVESLGWVFFSTFFFIGVLGVISLNSLHKLGSP